MSKGLPLANPAQQGLLVQGLIQQAWGNWIGTAMDLDFIITAGMNAPGTAATATQAGQSKTASGVGSITPQTPLNLILNWAPGQQLGDAVKQALQVALPGFTTSVNISSQLTNNKNQVVAGTFRNLGAFAQWLQARSIDIIGANPYGGASYRGVQLLVAGRQVNLFDGRGATQSNAKAIAFTDLVGQPTWLAGNRVQVTTVLRGDLSLDSVITLPQTQVTIQGSQGISYRDASIFKGNFGISQIRHVGRYKNPDGTKWCTMIDAYPATSANSNVASSNAA